MAVSYEIPLSPQPQAFSIKLGDVERRMRLTYRDAPEAGWILDIGTSEGQPLVTGIPLVTGADLLEQYAYLRLGGQLFVETDGDPDEPPTFRNLGVGSHLYFVVP